MTIDYSLYLVTGRDLLPEGMVRHWQLNLFHSHELFTDLSRLLGRSWFPLIHPGVRGLTTPYQSLRGGVTIVQIREKKADTLEVR